MNRCTKGAVKLIFDKPERMIFSHYSIPSLLTVVQSLVIRYHWRPVQIVLSVPVLITVIQWEVVKNSFFYRSLYLSLFFLSKSISYIKLYIRSLKFSTCILVVKYDLVVFISMFKKKTMANPYTIAWASHFIILFIFLFVPSYSNSHTCTGTCGYYSNSQNDFSS